MHFDNIEDYNFDHGLGFNTQTGEYHSLNPHDLGRPLSHAEMDYNLLYQKQTINGWRIAGSSADLTLNATDLGKVLAFHKVAIDPIEDIGNVMYNRHIAAGLFVGQLIWIPILPAVNATTTIDPCAGFSVNPPSWTNSLTYQEAAATFNIVANNLTAAEGNIVTFTINTTGVVDGTTIPWTLGAPVSTIVPTAATHATTAAPAAQFGIQLVGYQPNEREGVGITNTNDNADGFTPLDVVGGQVSGEVTINGDSGTVTIQILLDTVAEQTELMVFTLGATDSAGNSTGGEFATVTIINITNLPTTIATVPTTIATTYPCIDDIVVVINDPVAPTTTINPCIDDIVVVINDPVAPATTQIPTLATSATSMATNMTTQSTTPTLNNGGGFGGGGGGDFGGGGGMMM
tara:strand:+ start:1924 stop:3132 length:1209 start_codon:yes stop_codon:yes gene_type:complete